MIEKNEHMMQHSHLASSDLVLFILCLIIHTLLSLHFMIAFIYLFIYFFNIYIFFCQNVAFELYLQSFILIMADIQQNVQKYVLTSSWNWKAALSLELLTEENFHKGNKTLVTNRFIVLAGH